MKKLTFLTALATLLFTSGLWAQVNIIPKVGVNVVDLRGDVEDFTFEGSTGFNVGIDFRFGDDFIFQPGIHYYNLRTDFEGLTEDFSTTVGNFSNESFRIPVMIGGGIGESEKLQLRLLVGGVAAFRMKVDSDVDGIFDDKDTFRPATYSAIGGIGADLGDLALGLTFEYGLSDVLEDGNGTKNNIASFTIGYVF